LEEKNQTLTETLEELRQINQTGDARLKQIEEDNVHLRNLLDEVEKTRDEQNVY
jgi:cell shape-determining protein MreC